MKSLKYTIIGMGFLIISAILFASSTTFSSLKEAKIGISIISLILGIAAFVTSNEKDKKE